MIQKCQEKKFDHLFFITLGILFSKNLFLSSHLKGSVAKVFALSRVTQKDAKCWNVSSKFDQKSPSWSFSWIFCAGLKMNDKINLHKYICTVLEKHTKTIVPMYCTSDAGDNAHLAKTKSESRHKKPSQSQHGDDLTEYVLQISGRETIQYICIPLY